MSARLDDLARLLLPGGIASWADLAEQVAMEHFVAADPIVDEEHPRGRTKPVRQARQHLFGALRGAGYGWSTIASVFGVDPSRVRAGVLLAGRRAGIEPARGIGMTLQGP